MSENDITVVTQSVLLSPATPRPMAESHTVLLAHSGSNKLANGTTDSKNNIINDYKNLERQCADLLLRNRRLVNDYEHSQRDLAGKNRTISCQNDQLRRLEAGIRELQAEISHTKEFYENQLFYYKDLVLQLQVKLKKMSQEISRLSSEDAGALRVDYDRLCKDFKVLQSKYELEQNLKVALMDQLEFLSRENEILVGQLNQMIDNGDDNANDSIVHYTHVEDDPDVLNDTWDELDGELVSHLAQLSPVKLGEFPNLDNSRVPSLEHNPNFQFPPSPDPNAKKRQLLPAQLRADTDFVLSPLKLANNNSATYFDDHLATANHQPTHRYSSSKPNHSRYNSHDILSIKVEFESESGQRVASAPGRENGTIESIEEEELAQIRGSTLRALTSSSNRNSLVGSNRNSVILENDMTKQEIMKLKFELQSLKLHNEKLLSYIGFELQKQKKNIKKLSSKSSLRGLNKRFEYSDAKLIERSKELLIHKKRVLRSVSINPILSKFHEDSGKRFGMLHKGLLSEFPFITSDEDDYGFMKHNDLYSQRVFSNALNSYLNIDEDIQGPKKHKSQLFHKNASFDDVSDSEVDNDEDDDWEDITGEDMDDIGIFSHIKLLLMGSAVKRKNDVVDDGLKYKFLSIAIAIMILGIRFSHDQTQHLQ